MVTSLIAVAIGLALGLLTNPGRGVALDTGGGRAPEHVGTWIDFLTGIIPTDLVGAFIDCNVLQIVFLGAVVGVAALQLGDKAEPFLTLNRSVLELVQKALWWVIRLAPLGTLGPHRQGRVARTAGTCWRRCATFTVDMYVGCLLVLVRHLPAAPRAVGRLSPLKFFAGAWPAIQLAFVSRSSVGTMPLTQQVPPSGSACPGLRLLRGAVRRDDQDGRLRGDLPRARGDLRRPDLRVPLGIKELPPDRVRLGGRLRRHRRPDRRDRHADADAVARWACRWRASACCSPSTRSWT